MSHRRRLQRASAGRPPLSLLPPCASLSLLPGTPNDIVELARTALIEGPALLARFDPDEAGLCLIHPRSEACPDHIARQGRVFATVEPLDELQALARKVRLEAKRRPGWFVVLLVGIECSATIHITSAERAAFERRAS
jgi:hypothetical protein